MFPIAPSVRCCDTVATQTQITTELWMTTPLVLHRHCVKKMKHYPYTGMRDATHCNICHRTAFVLEDRPVKLQNGVHNPVIAGRLLLWQPVNVELTIDGIKGTPHTVEFINTDVESISYRQVVLNVKPRLLVELANRHV